MSSNIGRSLGRQANIFINYRREDTAGHAGRLFDGLSGRFPGRVFMDIDTIEPGIDFVEIIEEAVGCCEVLIVMIGRDWLPLADDTGRRRLDNPHDFVRLEISTALAREIRVIPVLVEDATMPRPEDLPPERALLTRRNAIELSDGRWSFDVDRLIQTIEGVLQDKAPSALMPVVTIQEEPPAPPPPPEPALASDTRKARTWLAAVLVVLALAAWGGWKLDRPGTDPLLGSEETPAVDTEPLEEQAPEVALASPTVKKNPAVKKGHEQQATRKPAEKNNGFKKKAKRFGGRVRNWFSKNN